MFSTRLTRLNWLKMTNIRDCTKLIDNKVCPCGDNLRRLLLTKPKQNNSEYRIQRRIEIQEKKYKECFNLYKN